MFSPMLAASYKKKLVLLKMFAVRRGITALCDIREGADFQSCACELFLPPSAFGVKHLKIGFVICLENEFELFFLTLCC